MVFRYLKKKQGTVIALATSNVVKIRISNSLVDYTLSKIIITDNLFGLSEKSRRFLNTHIFNYICGELMIFNSVDLH